MSSLESLKKRKRESSTTESLLGNKDPSHARTISTHRTNITIGNCLRMMYTLIIWCELILFIALWSLYVAKPQSTKINIPLINNMTTLQAYYWTQIIVQATMIILCMIFFIEFIIYIDRDWIDAVKKEKDETKLKNAFASYRSESTDGFPQRNIKFRKSAASVVSYCNICSKLCSIKFCMGRIGAGIANIFTLTWSELHVLCMISCIYYLLAAMLRLYHLNESKRVLFTISDILTGFGIVLPPFAYHLCQKLKMIYDKNGSVSDATVAGSQWERSKGKSNWYQGTTQMSIVQASQSILNNKMIRFWMFIMFSVQFFIFIMEPILAPYKFKYYLNSMYTCSPSENTTNYICDSTTSAVVFTVHILIIRSAIPLLLLNTAFSFTPKSSHTAQIMHYYGFNNIITPSSVIMITIIEFGANYFLSKYYIIVTWIIAAIIICVSLWEMYIFVRLLTLAEDAENDQEQFYGFAQRLNASLFNYFSKGIFYIILWSVSFGALLLSNIPQQQNKAVYRQIPSIIFAATSMFLLVPLQKIAISPTYRSYFGRKHRVKYLVTFHIICLFSVIFIVDKIIFIATAFYYELLYWNENMMKNATFRTSFSLSFASIGFFIWLFGKYSGILYPRVPKTGKKNRKTSMTELSEFNNNNKTKNSKRKESKMSLTALYNMRHTPSLPVYDNEEEDNDFKQGIQKIGAAQPITQQRTKSLSINVQRTNSKKIEIGRNKSAEIKKGNSLSKFQNMRQQRHDSVYDHPTKYDDVVKRFGLKSGTVSIDNKHNLNDEEEKYSQQ